MDAKGSPRPVPPTAPRSLSPRVQELFHAAVDLPAAARQAYLDRACEGDADLRRWVERLLDVAGDDGDADGWLAPATRGGAGATGGTGAAEACPAFVGTYRVTRRLGQGGSGVVYEAEQQSPRRPVAVKVLRGGSGSGGRANRLADEADLLGRLRHPGIAQVYEAGVDAEGRPYLAMELVGPRTLTGYARTGGTGRGRPLPVATRLDLLADVCDAVDHAHAFGVVHLDLKPANILVDDAGRPKVLDFGIARLFGPRPATDVTASGSDGGDGRPTGTPAYMSPEQLAGRGTVDQRADVFALGVILLELLADGPAGGVGTAPVPMRYRRDLRAIAGRATAPDPAGRYATAAGLAADLRRCRSGHPVTARPTSRAYGARRFVRRHPALTLSTSVTVAVLIVATVVGTALAIKADAHRRAAEAYRRAAEDNLYLADLHLARAAVTAGRVGDAARLLDEAVGGQPGTCSLRGWEWNFLDRLAHPAVRVLDAPSEAEVRSVAVSRDGRRLAWGGGDGAVHVWSLGRPATGPGGGTVRPVDRLTLAAQAKGVSHVAFDPAGDRVASVGWDGRILLWDTATGRPLPAPQIPTGDPFHTLAWGPNGRWYAAAGRGRRVVVFDVATGAPRSQLSAAEENVTALAVSRDGRRLAAQSGQGKLTAWPLADRGGFPEPAGEAVVSGSQQDWASAMALSPDGRRVASCGSDGTVRVTGAGTGAEQLLIRAHDGWALSVDWSPDGSQLLTGGRDGQVRTWDALDGRPTRTFAGHASWVFAVVWCPDGTLVSGGRDGTVRLWPLGRGDGTEAVETPTHAAGGVAVHPDGLGTAVAGNDGVVRVWPAGPDRPSVDLPGPLDWATCIAVSPDGRWVAAGGRDGTVHVWPWPASGPPVPPRVLRGHSDWVQGLAFSPDSATLGSASRDGTVRLWDAATGAPRRTLAVGRPLMGIAFSPDGRRLAWAGAGRSAGLLDLASGRRVDLVGHQDSVNAVAVSPDGRTVATAGDDQTVRLWDARTGAARSILRGHTNSVTAVAFNPDGRRLASAGADHVVRLWDVATGRELTYCAGRLRPLTGVAFSPDGDRLIAVGDDPALFVWTARGPANRP